MNLVRQDPGLVALVSFAAVAILSGCAASGAYLPKDKPNPLIASGLCERVEHEINRFLKEGEKDVFSPRDIKVVWWGQFGQFGSFLPPKLRAFWYVPDGALFLEKPFTPYLYTMGTVEYASTSLPVQGTPAALKTGRWTLQIFLGQALIDRKSFTIAERVRRGPEGPVELFPSPFGSVLKDPSVRIERLGSQRSLELLPVGGPKDPNRPRVGLLVFRTKLDPSFRKEETRMLRLKPKREDGEDQDDEFGWLDLTTGPLEVFLEDAHSGMAVVSFLKEALRPKEGSRSSSFFKPPSLRFSWARSLFSSNTRSGLEWGKAPPAPDHDFIEWPVSLTTPLAQSVRAVLLALGAEVIDLSQAASSLEGLEGGILLDTASDAYGLDYFLVLEHEEYAFHFRGLAFLDSDAVEGTQSGATYAVQEPGLVVLFRLLLFHAPSRENLLTIADALYGWPANILDTEPLDKLLAPYQKKAPELFSKIAVKVPAKNRQELILTPQDQLNFALYHLQTGSGLFQERLGFEQEVSIGMEKRLPDALKGVLFRKLKAGGR